MALSTGSPVHSGTFQFGESPFHAKGVLYRGTQSFFKHTVPGGMDALLETLGPGPLAEFIGQTFLASSWYDVMPVPGLIDAEARTMGKSLEEYLLHRTRWQAEQDLNGVYQFLLKLVSPLYVADRLPTLLTRMFDFPELEVEKPDEQNRVAHFHKIPVVLDTWLRQAFAVYIEAILGHAGASRVDISFDTKPESELVEGVATETLSYRIHWS